MIVVSHDRAFLSQTTDRLLEVNIDGTLGDVAGGIDAWIARSAGVIDSPMDSKEASTSSDTASKGKLLREAEKEINRLERQVTKMADKVMHTEDFVEAGKLNKELKTLRASLQEAEERWLALSEL